MKLCSSGTITKGRLAAMAVVVMTMVVILVMVALFKAIMLVMLNKPPLTQKHNSSQSIIGG